MSLVWLSETTGAVRCEGRLQHQVENICFVADASTPPLLPAVKEKKMQREQEKKQKGLPLICEGVQTGRGVSELT